MGLYSIINNINGADLFKYAMIIIIFLVIFSFNVLLALLLAVLFIWYDYEKVRVTNSEPRQQEEMKTDTIIPPVTNFRENPDIIDFLFSIQNWYHYNPLAYEEMMNNLELYFQLYHQIETGAEFCDFYYQNAEIKKQNALNAFQSMIFTIPTNNVIMDKFNRAHRRLNTILTKYQNQMYNICQYSLRQHGYDINKLAINTGPKEYNIYDNKDFTYQFY